MLHTSAAVSALPDVGQRVFRKGSGIRPSRGRILTGKRYRPRKYADGAGRMLQPTQQKRGSPGVQPHIRESRCRHPYPPPLRRLLAGFSMIEYTDTPSDSELAVSWSLLTLFTHEVFSGEVC